MITTVKDESFPVSQTSNQMIINLSSSSSSSSSMPSTSFSSVVVVANGLNRFEEDATTTAGSVGDVAITLFATVAFDTISNDDAFRCDDFGCNNRRKKFEEHDSNTTIPSLVHLCLQCRF